MSTRRAVTIEMVAAISIIGESVVMERAREPNKSVRSADVKKAISTWELIESGKTCKQRPVSWRPKYEPFTKLLRSRYIGVIMGPMYAVLVYYYIAFMIWSPTPPLLVAGLNPQLDGQSNASQPAGASNQTLAPDVFERHIVASVLGAGVGVFLAVAGLFSRRVRCTMMLLVPSLFVRRGRALMLTTAAGLLLSGPVLNVENNIEGVVQTMTCLYNQTRGVGVFYVDQVNNLADAGGTKAKQVKSGKIPGEGTCHFDVSVLAWPANIFTESNRVINQCDIPFIAPEINANSKNASFEALADFVNQIHPDANLTGADWGSLASEVEYSSTKQIRHRLANILTSFFEYIDHYLFYVRRLCYLSILLIVWDVMCYIHRYYSDDSFDNKLVSDELRALWKSGYRPKLLPLRRWELAEKYRYTTTIVLSRAELKRILMNSITGLLFTLVVIAFVAGDYGLASIIQATRDDAQFGVIYDGMDQGNSFKSFLPDLKTGARDLTSIGLKAFNLSTEPCLPTAKFTDSTYTYGILALMLLYFLCNVFDVYAARLCARICQLYFPGRAKKRAEYLYERLEAGRRERKIRLPLILSRQLSLHTRAAELYTCACSCKHVTKRQICPGCRVIMKADEGTPYSFNHHGEKEELPICPDCSQDVG